MLSEKTLPTKRNRNIRGEIARDNWIVRSTGTSGKFSKSNFWSWQLRFNLRIVAQISEINRVHVKSFSISFAYLEDFVLYQHKSFLCIRNFKTFWKYNIKMKKTCYLLFSMIIMIIMIENSMYNSILHDNYHSAKV